MANPLLSASPRPCRLAPAFASDEVNDLVTELSPRLSAFRTGSSSTAVFDRFAAALIGPEAMFL